MAMLMAAFRSAATGRTWCIGSRLRCDDSSGGRAHTPSSYGRCGRGVGNHRHTSSLSFVVDGRPDLVEALRVQRRRAWGTVQVADANESLSGDSGPGAGCLGTRGLGDPVIDVGGETDLFLGSLEG